MQQRMINPKPNNLVKKHEALLLARYDLSELALKLLATIITMIRVEDKDFNIYILRIIDFKELTGYKGKDLYEKLHEVAKELQKEEILIARPNNGFLSTRWVASTEYVPGTGEIEFEISPKLKPYLLELKSNFLQYEIKNILSLKSNYVIRLYELLKHKYNEVNNYTGNKVVSYEINVEEFRNVFQVPDSYRYDSIKRRILEKAKNQFAEKTDITIKYEEVKRGRRVDKITFTIRENSNDENFLKSEKLFIEYMRKNYVNQDIFSQENMVLSISPNGRIYNKRNNNEYNNKDAQTVWTTWYNLAKEDKLTCLKQGVLF